MNATQVVKARPGNLGHACRFGDHINAPGKCLGHAARNAGHCERIVAAGFGRIGEH